MPRPNNPDEQSVHLHYVRRSLVTRAHIHAKSLGLSMKEWIVSLIERALGGTTEPNILEKVCKVTVEEIQNTLAPKLANIDRSDTLPPEAPGAKPPVGRRDL